MYKVKIARSEGLIEEIYHCGQKIEDLDEMEFGAILHVYADGDELAAILKEFANLPHYRGSSCQWFSGLAQLIHAQLVTVGRFPGKSPCHFPDSTVPT